MTGGAGGSSDSSIYHLFVEQAQRLRPRYLNMVTPSRWLAGGRGLEKFRTQLLGGGHLRALVDYPVVSEAFPASADFEGGISYFLWDANYEGECDVTVLRSGVARTSRRNLAEFDVFIRDPRSVDILQKVRSVGEVPLTSVLAKDTPFGMATNFTDFRDSPFEGDIPLYYTRLGKRSIGYVKPGSVLKNEGLIDTWKVLTPEAFGERGAEQQRVLGMPWIASSPSVCTQSFLFIWCQSEAEAQSIRSYYATKFFRFLVSLRKITQHAIHSTYAWVPLQTWDRIWTDAELYAKYGLDKDEIAYVDSVIKPMDLGSTSEGK